MTRRLPALVMMLYVFCSPVMADQASMLAEIRQRLQQQTDQFDFTQERQMVVLARPMVSSGRLQFSQNAGLCWQLSTPYTAVMLINSDGIYQIEESRRKQLMASGNPVFETFSHVYMALFRGDLVPLQRDFTLAPALDANGWIIRLQPKPGSALGWLREVVLEQRGDVTRLRLQEHHGDSVDLRFTPVVPTATGDQLSQSACW